MGVYNQQQGNGFGTKLIKQIIDEHKGYQIHLQTSNQRNFPLYEKLGFRYDGEYTQQDYYVKIYTYLN